MRRATIALFAALLITAQSEHAAGQQAGRPPLELLRTLIQLDADGDQAVSRGEVPESARDSFEVLLKHGDTDGNGQLAQEELRGLMGRLRPSAGTALGQEALARRFKAADRDGNGTLSRAEFPGGEALFDRMDRDKDGAISRDEARAGMRAPAPRRPDGAPTGSRRPLRLDRNGNGQADPRNSSIASI